MNRYIKNGIFTSEEMSILRSSNICIIGCGGLGGHILEMLARLGVGNLTIVDGDVFDESNLNRQILSSESNIGKSKVMEALKRIESINSDVVIKPINEFVTGENVNDIIKSSELVIDALDSIDDRKILAHACESSNKIMIHGAIAGWYGQVSTIYPGDKTIDRLYPSKHKKGVEVSLGNPSFTPALIASIQVSEALKVITSKPHTLRNKIMYIDLLYNDFEVIEI
ncbi:MAG: HesA/MoeB/ThiF family protein [Acidaminobacteraceae bacterium]